MKVKIKLRNSLQAGPGISIASAEANTIISTTAAEEVGSAYTEGTAVEVVQGSDSKLVKVVQHSTYATPTAFPAILKTVASSITSRMDLDGISCEYSTFDFQVRPSSQNVGIYNSGGDSIELDVSGGTADILVTRGARTLSIIEIDVCDSGLARKMLVLGSAPYAP